MLLTGRDSLRVHLELTLAAQVLEGPGRFVQTSVRANLSPLLQEVARTVEGIN